jgi:hypothetical protein
MKDALVSDVASLCYGAELTPSPLFNLFYCCNGSCLKRYCVYVKSLSILKVVEPSD